jgi:hypothetical protein
MGTCSSSTHYGGAGWNDLPPKMKVRVMSELPSHEIRRMGTTSRNTNAAVDHALSQRYRTNPYELQRDSDMNSPIPNIWMYYVDRIKNAADNNDFKTFQKLCHDLWKIVYHLDVKAVEERKGDMGLLILEGLFESRKQLALWVMWAQKRFKIANLTEMYLETSDGILERARFDAYRDSSIFDYEQNMLRNDNDDDD